jgi:hypothetical protein
MLAGLHEHVDNDYPHARACSERSIREVSQKLQKRGPVE